MPFDHADYQRAAAHLCVPVPHVMAMCAVESSGETFWVLDGRLEVPVRFEAHWFGKLTDYRFNASHPDLSCRAWNPDLAAHTKAGAWDQVRRARALDPSAADQATSWGGFQVMGYHWKRLGYSGIGVFVASMSANGDDGQMDAFTRYIDADDMLQEALRTGDWETVETLYNGGGYGGAYAVKLRAAAALYAGTGGATAGPPPRVLRVGDRGADVAALQVALGILADGDFGPVTLAAVQRLQGARGLVVDGIVGVMTRQALGL
ncbi:N-acetylmuramidase domain-containing protein [Reyranella sp.]|uniref:N-acetylmuramidase domain-containing protein n=1 Tax=Reyranella sp. TaxID=1929291 RepID=UPI003C7BD4C5